MHSYFIFDSPNYKNVKRVEKKLANHQSSKIKLQKSESGIELQNMQLDNYDAGEAENTIGSQREGSP